MKSLNLNLKDGVIQMNSTFFITRPVLDFDGKEIKEGGKIISYGNIMILSLMNNTPEDQKLSVEEKLKRFTLAQRISSCLNTPDTNGELVLSWYEIQQIMDCANKTLTLYSLGKLNEFFNQGGLT